jgi:hypothetical protein
METRRIKSWSSNNYSVCVPVYRFFHISITVIVIVTVITSKAPNRNRRAPTFQFGVKTQFLNTLCIFHMSLGVSMPYSISCSCTIGIPFQLNLILFEL